MFSHHHKRKASLVIGEAKPKDLMHRDLLCRNSSARDPSPLAQDDMLGVRRLFHSNDSFGSRCLGMEVPSDLRVPGRVMTLPYRCMVEGRVPWDGCTAEIRTVGRGSRPRRTLPGALACSIETHRTPKSVIARPRRGRGNPFPCKPQGLRAPAGAQVGPDI